MSNSATAVSKAAITLPIEHLNWQEIGVFAALGGILVKGLSWLIGVGLGKYIREALDDRLGTVLKVTRRTRSAVRRLELDIAILKEDKANRDRIYVGPERRKEERREDVP